MPKETFTRTSITIRCNDKKNPLTLYYSEPSDVGEGFAYLSGGSSFSSIKLRPEWIIELAAELQKAGF
jgi:hypothetical protein